MVLSFLATERSSAGAEVIDITHTLACLTHYFPVLASVRHDPSPLSLPSIADYCQYHIGAYSGFDMFFLGDNATKLSIEASLKALQTRHILIWLVSVKFLS